MHRRFYFKKLFLVLSYVCLHVWQRIVNVSADALGEVDRPLELELQAMRATPWWC